MAVNAQVDAERRLDIMRNHTTAHLLHYALRQVIGDKAEQRGSYVGPDRLRFDFRHGTAVTPDQREEIEEIVNRRILENAPVVTRVMPVDQARKAGAIALFGEKYGEEVRVLFTGDYSIELCGGTHMKETAPIGSFRLVAEESISAGIRRVEGVTGIAAFRLSRDQGELLGDIGRELRTPPREAKSRIRALSEHLRELEKTVTQLRLSAARERAARSEPTMVGDARLLAMDVGETGAKELGELAREVLAKLGENGVAVLAGRDGDKAAIAVAVGKGLAPARIKAGDIVKRLSASVGGGGGGRPDFAQAGGREAEKIHELVSRTPAIVDGLLR
jgi:alanyl-tRNA synthetase